MSHQSNSQIDLATQTLSRYFGYQEFREGQQVIVNSILKGHDTLAIRSTGSGKSICFQVPALSFAGLTIVISPLISLMADQVSALKKRNIPAAFLNSSLSAAENKQIMEQLGKNFYKLIYLSPEKLSSAKFVLFLKQLKISFIAVDEAHCISMWGHDFRPSYNKIPLFINQLAVRPIVAAFTATATFRIQQDIIQALQLQQPNIFKQSSLRTNLCLNVIPCASKAEKQLVLIKLLKKFKTDAGIIYCSTRNSTEAMANMINQLNIKQQLTDSRAEPYHGGLESAQRAQIQENFLTNKIKLICATNAFGMGVDKSDIRFVIHYELPANLENYYQEVGRAGRDGKKSACFLLFWNHDVAIQQGLLNNKSKQRYKIESKKLQTIVQAMTKGDCLQQTLAHYFGDQLDHPCGECGFCQNFQLALSDDEQEVWQQITQHPILSKLPFQTQYFISLLNPTSTEEWQKIPGIGQGVMENLFSSI